jgi:two-component system catabolic regulation response regulator CreB
MKPRILIIDDERSIVDNIQYVLEKEGYICHAFFEGLPSLSYLDENSVNLIVLDIGLPDINGFELCKQIRKKRQIPIIFLTARSDEIDRVLGLELGGDDYVTKPFSPRELAARVKAVLRRTATNNNYLNHNDNPVSDMPSKTFKVDDSKKQIIYFGVFLELSKYEYEILKTFIKKPGHVYSRDQLMEMIWEEPDTSLDRTIDAHIKNIRAKMRAIKPENDPIITHRGMGYSLKEDL